MTEAEVITLMKNNDKKINRAVKTEEKLKEFMYFLKSGINIPGAWIYFHHLKNLNSR